MAQRKTLQGSNHHLEHPTVLLCGYSYHQIHYPRSFEEIFHFLLHEMQVIETDKG